MSSVRDPSTLSTYLSLTTTASIPLLAFFTTSACPSCKIVNPIIRALLEKDGVGEKEGGVAFAEVEMDAPDCSELAFRYLVSVYQACAGRLKRNKSGASTGAGWGPAVLAL